MTSDSERIRIGVLRLTDSAPMIVAHELGFFADEGLDIGISVEPSWANVADKLAHGALDAAVILPPLALAITLGARGPAEPLVIPFSFSLGGDAITLSKHVAASLRDEAREVGYAAALAARLKRSPAAFGVVHDYSNHNLWLRYWLAAAGANGERDYDVAVTPPARMVEALQSGRILGFCAGAPWGDVAERVGAGVTVATTADIWRAAPGKALALRERWVETHREAAFALLRALRRAARFCNAPENAAYVASLLSRRAWLALDAHAILAALPGASGRNRLRFHAGAATYPWRSHALWFLAQMTRWGLIAPGLPLPDIAAQVYRPDLYAEALAPAGELIPLVDSKAEGEHEAAWLLPAHPQPIAMTADRFCDVAVFDPAKDL